MVDVDGEYVFITDEGKRLDIEWGKFSKEFKETFQSNWERCKRETPHPFRLCALEKLAGMINEGQISPETNYEKAYFTAIDAIWEEDICPNKKVS
jgi:hypothetical protein